MSKHLKIILIIVIGLFFTIGVMNFFSPHLEYDEGRDSIKAYGNGKYQLLVSSGKNGIQEKNLTNCEYHTSVINNVFIEQKKSNNVYFIGVHYENKVMAILDTNTNKLKYFAESTKEDDIKVLYAYDMIQKNELIILSDFDEFSEKERECFNKLKTTLANKTK